MVALISPEIMVASSSGLRDQIEILIGGVTLIIGDSNGKGI